MANTYDITQKLQAIADAIENGGGGGGGTTVIANPSGTPTADLDTIQIGQTIYDIPGSGGGGQPFSAADIYENQTTSNENTISLTASYQNFDEVRILVKENVDDIYYPEQIISKSELDTALNDQTNVSMTPYFFSGSYYCYYKVTSTTTLVLQSQAGAFHIRKIIGIKYGNGVGTDDAVNVNYDNTTSGLTATNVQDAIDELDTSIDAINSNLHKHSTGTTFAELNTVLNTLTNAQYFSSNIVFWSSGIGYNLIPTRGDAKVWAMVLAGSASYMSRMYQFVKDSTTLPQTQKNNDGTITSSNLTVTGWDLYYIG